MQRQQFALVLVLLRLLEQGHRIVNVDETWLNESSFVRRVWADRRKAGNATLLTLTPRISMIGALDSEGKVWFSLTQATTDSDVMAAFLKQLARTLDVEEPGWRENTVLLFDNATYHASNETMSVIRRLGLQVLFTGPYGYDASPMELLFSQLKQGELNPERLPTGKR